MRPLLASLVLVLATGSAHASGLLVSRFGSEWGHPTTDNLSGLYYNPAGLSLLGGTKLTLDGSFAWRVYTYDRDPRAIDNVIDGTEPNTGTPAGDGVAANSGEASLTNYFAIPFISFGSDFGIEGFGAAIGLYVPIGGQTVFDKRAPSDTFPGAEDGPARWWTIEGAARSIYLSAGAGYRIEPLRLSIGVALDVVYSEVDNVQARNADGTDTLVANGNLQEGRVRVDVSGIDLALGVGLLWEPIQNLFIGVSYRSQPGFGEQTLDGTAKVVLGGGPLGDDITTDAEMRQSMPDVLRFGVRYGEPEKWQVRLFGDWQHWAVLTGQCVLDKSVANRTCDGAEKPGKILVIPRQWNNGWGVRAGGSYWLDKGVELVVGGGFDANAVPDKSIEPAYYDADKVTATLGARIALLDALVLEATYTQVLYFDRDVAPRGRITLDPNDSRDPDDAGVPTISDYGKTGIDADQRVPDAAGSYSQTIGLLEVGLTYSF